MVCPRLSCASGAGVVLRMPVRIRVAFAVRLAPDLRSLLGFSSGSGSQLARVYRTSGCCLLGAFLASAARQPRRAYVNFGRCIKVAS